MQTTGIDISTDTAHASTRIAPAVDALGAHPNTGFEVSHGAAVAPFPESDEAINRAVARFQDHLDNWQYRSIELAPVVRNVRDWARDLWGRFLPKQWGDRLITPPAILFRFEWASPRVLGHYQAGRNDSGFRWEISLNPRHLVRWSDVDVASTVLHELLHCFEDLVGRAPRSRNNYHSAWFRKTADEFGIPCTRYGREMGVRDPGPFTEWVREHGLAGSPIAIAKAEDLPPVRGAKRVAWRCSCPGDVQVSVLVARGSELHARCELCGRLFERARQRRG